MVYRKAIHLIELIAPPPLPVLSCLHMTIQRMSSTNLFALFSFADITGILQWL